MSDTPAPVEIPLVGQMDLWHPAGVKVRLPVVLTTWKGSLDAITEALEAGWLVNAPGLEEGEEKDEVGYVVRFQKEDTRGGGMVEIVDLYSPNDGMKHKILTVYLNTADEVAAFEQASGMRIDKLPIYIGTGHIERGKDRRLDAMVVKAPRVFHVAHVKHPKYKKEDEDAAKKTGATYFTPRRRFTRWPGSPQAAAPENKPTDPNEQVVTPEQAKQLLGFLELSGVTLVQFANEFKCHPNRLPVSRFTEARDRLKAVCDKKVAAAAQTPSP